MNDLVQIEPISALISASYSSAVVSVKPDSLSLEGMLDAAERVSSQGASLLTKIVVGTLAFDRIRRNYESKLPEVKRAGLLDVPIQVVAWLPPKQIVLLDAEDHVIKTLECE